MIGTLYSPFTFWRYSKMDCIWSNIGAIKIDVIANTLEGAKFFEIHENFARNVVGGFGRLNGNSVGIIANQPEIMAGSVAEFEDLLNSLEADQLPRQKNRKFSSAQNMFNFVVRPE